MEVNEKLENCGWIFLRFWGKDIKNNVVACADEYRKGMEGKRMIRFAAEEYQECKKWIAEKIQSGYSWNDVKKLCVSNKLFEDEFYRLQDDEMIIPPTMKPEEWELLVCEQEENHIPIVDMFGGISSEGRTNTFSVPTGVASAWNNYKNYLLGRIGR